MSKVREKPRSAASEALIELRQAMGMTQQRFAVEVLDVAVPTVARYETSLPPKGKVLLRLAMVAHARGCRGPAEAFRDLYLEEISADLKMLASWSNPPATPAERDELQKLLEVDETGWASVESVADAILAAGWRKDHNTLIETERETDGRWIEEEK